MVEICEDVPMPNFTTINYPVHQIALWGKILGFIIYLIIIFISVIGNTAIIVIVARHQYMRTAHNLYILNVSVADLTVTLLCLWMIPVATLLELNSALKAVLCKFGAFVECMYYCN